MSHHPDIRDWSDFIANNRKHVSNAEDDAVHILGVNVKIQQYSPNFKSSMPEAVFESDCFLMQTPKSSTYSSMTRDRTSATWQSGANGSTAIPSPFFGIIAEQVCKQSKPLLPICRTIR